MILCEWDAPEGDPGQSCIQMLARILSAIDVFQLSFNFLCLLYLSQWVHTRRAVRGVGVNILEEARHRISLLQYNLSTVSAIGSWALRAK
jgi:hypothetical protein